eukprot:1242534-Amphidinium_carterae.6
MARCKRQLEHVEFDHGCQGTTHFLALPMCQHAPAPEELVKQSHGRARRSIRHEPTDLGV